MPPKHYRDVYLREETYQKLMQLKAVLGKRSVNDVVEELLKCVTVNTVSSPVSTGKVTVSTVKPTVSTGEPPVSTVSSPVNTVKHGEDPSNGELLERLDALEMYMLRSLGNSETLSCTVFMIDPVGSTGAIMYNLQDGISCRLYRIHPV